MPAKKIFVFGLSLFVMTLLLTFCSTKTVVMTVMRPAEVNLKNYPKIAFGDFTNPAGRVDRHARDVAEILTARLIATGRFDVVDREHLKTILKEQTLAASGLIDESSAPELGRLLGASALIFGRIQTDHYQEKVSKDKPYKDKKKRTHQRHHRYGTYRFTVAVKIIDVQTGKILTVKEIDVEEKAHTSALDKPAPPIDRQALYKRCLDKVALRFEHLVAPYKQKVRAAFVMDDQLPGAKKAVGLFKAGEWDTGLELLKQEISKPGLKPEVQAKAFYNLGLAQMYLGQHDQAIVNLKKALSLQPDESRYQKALKQAKAEKEEAERLKEQL